MGVSSLVKSSVLSHFEVLMNETPLSNCADFPKTRWSLVLAAGGTDQERRHEALTELCRQYWYPLYVYARSRGVGPEDAQDLTQGYFENLLKMGALGRMGGAECGRMRSFLLAGMQNWMRKEQGKARAVKRGCGQIFSMDALSAEERYRIEPRQDETPESLYERRWAWMVVQQALVRLRRDYESAGKGVLAELLIPLLSRDDGRVPMAEVAAQAGVAEGHARVLLHRIRKHFRAALREEIAQTVSSVAEVDLEMRHLQEILTR